MKSSEGKMPSPAPRAVLVARHKRPQLRAGGEPAAAPPSHPQGCHHPTALSTRKATARSCAQRYAPRGRQQGGELQAHYPISTPNLAIHASKAN